MKSTCWITGVYGFIGQHLSQYLHSLGHSVLGIGTNNSRAKHHLNASYLVSELSDCAFDSMVVRSGYPDIVFHLAGGSSVNASIDSPQRDFERTVLSTQCLCEWIRKHNKQIRIVYLSSAAVYGDKYNKPITEDSVSLPYSPYGSNKLIGEQICLNYAFNFGMNVSIARVFSVYGPALRKQLIWDFCHKLIKSEGKVSLGGSGDETRDWIHINNLVEMIARIGFCTTQPVITVNMGTGRGITVKDFCALMLDRWNLINGSSLQVEFTGINRLGNPHYLVSDNTRLHSLIGGIEYIDLESGLAEYVDRFYGSFGDTIA